MSKPIKLSYPITRIADDPTVVETVGLSGNAHQRRKVRRAWAGTGLRVMRYPHPHRKAALVGVGAHWWGCI
jgi:hypothetical protein